MITHDAPEVTCVQSSVYICAVYPRVGNIKETFLPTNSAIENSKTKGVNQADNKGFVYKTVFEDEQKYITGLSHDK